MHFKKKKKKIRCGGVCSSIMSLRPSFRFFLGHHGTWQTIMLYNWQHRPLFCGVFHTYLSPSPLLKKINIFIFLEVVLLVVGCCSMELLWCFHDVCLKWSTWIRFFHLSLQNMKLFWLFQRLIFFVWGFYGIKIIQRRASTVWHDCFLWAVVIWFLKAF